MEPDWIGLLRGFESRTPLTFDVTRLHTGKLCSPTPDRDEV